MLRKHSAARYISACRIKALVKAAIIIHLQGNCIKQLKVNDVSLGRNRPKAHTTSRAATYASVVLIKTGSQRAQKTLAVNQHS